MKKYCATFKFFGKKYGIRKGSNLHAIGVLSGMVASTVVTYVLLCMATGLGSTL